MASESDLGLHCLPTPLLWDARLKLVNMESDLFIKLMTGNAICKRLTECRSHRQTLNTKRKYSVLSKCFLAYINIRNHY